MRLQYTNRTTFNSGYAIYHPSGSQYGLKVLDWSNTATSSPPIGNSGTTNITSTDKTDGAGATLTLSHGGSIAKYTAQANSGLVALAELPRCIGIFAKNTSSSTLMFSLHLWDATKAKRIKVINAVEPSSDWQFIICQEQQYSVSTLTVGDVISHVSALEETSGTVTLGWGDWPTGSSLLLGNIYINTRSRPKFIPRMDDGINSALVNGASYPTGYPTSGGNYKSILDYYGYRGTLLLVGEWVNTVKANTTYLTTAQIQSLLDAGWSAVNHSYQHPSNGTAVSYGSAGLRLLGPQGYYYSQQTTQGYAYGAMSDCQITSATAANDTLTTKAAHNFIAGQKLELVDLIPTGLQLGVTYFVKTVPTNTTFTLSSTKNLSDTVDITADWSDAGGANFRWPGSTADDNGIYNDIILARDTLNALNLSGDVHFDDVLALPQGGWDPYVISACERAGIVDIWSTCSPAQGQISITTGKISGSGNNGSTCNLSGAITLTGAIQVDGVASPTLTQVNAFTDQCCHVGGTGSCVTHGIDATVSTRYDGMLAHVQMLQRQGMIDVVSFAEWRKGK